MPASRIPRTKGAAEPSRIGTSGPFDFDHRVVDAAARQRGHDMFDRGNRGRPVAVETCTQAALRDTIVARPGYKGAPGRSTRRNQQAHVCGMGTDGHPRKPARVEPNAAETHIRSDRRLHVENLSSLSSPCRVFRVRLAGPCVVIPARPTPPVFRGDASARSAPAVSVAYGLPPRAGTDNSTIMTGCNNADSSRQEPADACGASGLAPENKEKGVGVEPTPSFRL